MPAAASWANRDRRAKTKVILADVRLDRRESWYLRHGDWFAGSCLAATILLAGVGAVAVWRPKRNKATSGFAGRSIARRCLTALIRWKLRTIATTTIRSTDAGKLTRELTKDAIAMRLHKGAGPIDHHWHGKNQSQRGAVQWATIIPCTPLVRRNAPRRAKPQRTSRRSATRVRTSSTRCGKAATCGKAANWKQYALQAATNQSMPRRRNCARGPSRCGSVPQNDHARSSQKASCSICWQDGFLECRLAWSAATPVNIVKGRLQDACIRRLLARLALGDGTWSSQDMERLGNKPLVKRLVPLAS